MKILHINSFDSRGGAAIAALRLHRTLCKKGLDSKFVCLTKNVDDETVIPACPNMSVPILSKISELDKLPLLLTKADRPFPLSPAWISLGGRTVQRIINTFAPDIIHLHWIASGMLNITDIAHITAQKPVIWTMHDMWPFTGGCHYNSGCKHYETGCGACPLLKSESKTDLSSRIFERKKNTWLSKNVTLVSPSRWLNDLASFNVIFNQSRREVIPNGVTSDHPVIDRNEIRKRFGLPPDKRLILVSDLRDPRKGPDVFFKSLACIDSSCCDIVTMGKSRNNLPKASFRIHNIGHLSSADEIASLYAAADLFVLPSLEDNFPNTVLESMSVGTPVVAFRKGGGASEIIEHKVNGYLVDSFSPRDLEQGLSWILNNNSYDTIRKAAYNTIQHNYTLNHMANRYITLYQQILNISNNA